MALLRKAARYITLHRQPPSQRTRRRNGMLT
ncbi:Uncharacterised protein [Vibrio cholerae]|nr:Uncharacterised protein [Vibrio cholerae]